MDNICIIQFNIVRSKIIEAATINNVESITNANKGRVLKKFWNFPDLVCGFKKFLFRLFTLVSTDAQLWC